MLDPSASAERPPDPGPDPGPRSAPPRPAHAGAEVWIVLLLSLLQSGVYAVVSIVDKLTQDTALSKQVATLNGSQSPRAWLDLTYQLLGIGFALVPVALVWLLLTRSEGSASRVLGLDRSRPARDVLQGAGLALLIGVPGLGLYLAARALGVNATVAASGLSAHWWTVPVLVLSAVQNAVLEETIVVGYLVTRLRQRAWLWPVVFGASALLRGSYHLYQGFGGFAGNVVMGLVFCEVYRRTGRVAPLVVAHALIDVVAFVGYALLGHSALGHRLGLA